MFLDWFNLWILLAGMVAALTSAFLVGVLVGRRLSHFESDADQKAHGNVVLTALLALLALLLAFSFSVAQDRYMTRKKLVLDEANAIGTAYLRARMVPSPQSEALQALLKRYVEARLAIENEQGLARAIRQSTELQGEIWVQATILAKQNPESVVVGLLVRSLNDAFDLQEERLIVAVYQRIPVVILGTLVLIALLSITFLGYSAGPLHLHSVLPAFAFIAAISGTIVLIIELDRPWNRLLEVSQQATLDVHALMKATP